MNVERMPHAVHHRSRARNFPYLGNANLCNIIYSFHVKFSAIYCNHVAHPIQLNPFNRCRRINLHSFNLCKLIWYNCIIFLRISNSEIHHIRISALHGYSLAFLKPAEINNNFSTLTRRNEQAFFEDRTL